MSLVPHPITAIERDVADADASGKQVIVGATCSMFLQPANSAVIMYDDAAGSNGSTAKTTGANGQVIVYINPGTYRINVNGQDSFIYIATNVNIGSVSNPHMYATLYSFVNALPFSAVFTDGDWIQFAGRTLEFDGHLSKYQVTNVAPTIRRNYENYIPINGDGDSTGVTLWAVLKEGFKRNFQEQSIEIIAHRSFTDAGIENTEFNDGFAVKYDIQSLETDVQVTSDSQLIRYHDTNVSTLTNGTGEIKNLTYAQVRALIFDSVAGTVFSSRIKIARFDEFVKFAKSVGARIYPEIKQYRTLADIQLIVDVIEFYSYESMTVLQSFDIDDLVEVRRINKTVGVGWTTGDISTEQHYIDFDKLQKLKFADVLIGESVIVATPSLVTLIYDAGLGCVAWGIDNNTEIKDVLGVGVYRHMLDQPQLIASIRGLKNVNY